LYVDEEKPAPENIVRAKIILTINLSDFGLIFIFTLAAFAWYDSLSVLKAE
jgi:hypothetical protein